MIEWKKFDRQNPPSDGQYIIYCVTPQFDSAWIDIARFDDGVWHAFRSQMSHDLRVREYAETNYPESESAAHY